MPCHCWLAASPPIMEHCFLLGNAPVLTLLGDDDTCPATLCFVVKVVVSFYSLIQFKATRIIHHFTFFLPSLHPAS
jgi:hypothetical protein